MEEDSISARPNDSVVLHSLSLPKKMRGCSYLHAELYTYASVTIHQTNDRENARLHSARQSFFSKVFMNILRCLFAFFSLIQ